MSNLLKKLTTYKITVLVGWFSRVVCSGIQVFIVPFALRYLGVSDYAIFAIVTGLLGWFSLADLGMGAYLQNQISVCRVNAEDPNLFLRQVTLLILLLAFCEVVIFALLAPELQHLLLRKLMLHAPPVLLYAGIGYLLMSIAGVSYKVLFSLQKGYVAYLYQMVGVMLAFVLTVSVALLMPNQSKLLTFTLCWVWTQVVVTGFCFFRIFPWPDFSNLKTQAVQIWWPTVKKGSHFGVIALTAVLVLGVDYIVMSQTVSSQAIVIYSVINKIFTVVYFVYNSMLIAFWPILREKFLGNHPDKIEQMNRDIIRMICAGILYIILATLLVVVFKKWIEQLLLGPGLLIPVVAIIFFGVYHVVKVYTETYAVALQSRNHTLVFLWGAPFQIVINLVLMYYLSLDFGLVGVVLALMLGYLCTTTWTMPCMYYWLNRQMKVSQ